VDAERLEFGDGLEVLVQAVLAGMRVGETVCVYVCSANAALEFPAWSRVQGHETVAIHHDRRGNRHHVTLRRGAHERVLAPAVTTLAPPRALRDGEFHSGDMRVGVPPPHLPPHVGFTPLESVAESGGPRFDWRLSDRDTVWAPEVAELAEQSSAKQWDASRDIPWQAAQGVPEYLERAVAQVMTFIAQNEYAALYVPAAFLPQLHPSYVEVLMWLAGHVHDEARHIEVFTKRSLLGGYRGYALASTELSLHSLLAEHDFTAASLLLNVLGEGTFLDLLRFVERHAPDAATAAAARLAHGDERRHVHFGISHVRYAVGADTQLRAQLVQAAEQRAAKLTELSLSPLLTEGLTILAAGSLRPVALSEGARAVRGLMRTMERNRIRRLRSAGFTPQQARYLSDLHTPNLM
jgi:hypothetical protein